MKPAPPAEIDLTGLLTPDQLEHIYRLKSYIRKIQDAIDTANHEASRLLVLRPDGEPLRRIELWPAALLANDLSMVLFAHEQADKRIAAAVQDMHAEAA